MHTTTERDERLRALLDLVQAREFRTQSELVKALRRMDFQVTQSSVSRDIRDLGLRKRGGVYTAPREVLAGPDGVEVWDFAKSVIAAGDHMVVLKCQTAMAQPLAVAIDRARWPGVAGTIAGDDTVFIAVTDGEATRELVRRIGTIAELGPEPMR
ncbi:MAG: arginine repressor [Myxococcota bacterium]